MGWVTGSQWAWTFVCLGKSLVICISRKIEKGSEQFLRHSFIAWVNNSKSRVKVRKLARARISGFRDRNGRKKSLKWKFDSINFREMRCGVAAGIQFHSYLNEIFRGLFPSGFFYINPLCIARMDGHLSTDIAENNCRFGKRIKKWALGDEA